MSARPVIHATPRRIYGTTAEAFADIEPRTVGYACAIEGYRYQPPLAERIVIAVCLLSAIACVVMAWGGWLPGAST